MNFEKRKSKNDYTMNIGQNEPLHKIEKTLVERDLGVILLNNLKWALCH